MRKITIVSLLAVYSGFSYGFKPHHHHIQPGLAGVAMFKEMQHDHNIKNTPLKNTEQVWVKAESLASTRNQQAELFINAQTNLFINNATQQLQKYHVVTKLCYETANQTFKDCATAVDDFDLWRLDSYNQSTFPSMKVVSPSSSYYVSIAVSVENLDKQIIFTAYDKKYFKP